MTARVKVILTGAVLSASVSVFADNVQDARSTYVLANTTASFIGQYEKMTDDSEYYIVLELEKIALKAIESPSTNEQQETLEYLESFNNKLQSRCDETIQELRVCERLPFLRSAEISLRQLNAARYE